MSDKENHELAASLRPCPCCGAAAEFADTSGEIASSIGIWDYVLCNAAKGGCGMRSGHYDSQTEAAAAWNQRVNIPHAQADEAQSLDQQAKREAMLLQQAASIAYDRNVARSPVISRADNNYLFEVAHEMRAIAKRIEDGYK